MSEPLTILLVDDSPDDRSLAIRALRKEFPDCACIEAGTEEELAASLAAGSFDVVVTDYQLRWSDGLRVLREVLARDPDVPVIMFTNTGTEEVCVEAMKAGLTDYVIKNAKHYVRLPMAVRHGLEHVGLRRALDERLEAEQAARRQAEEANRSKDEFLGAVSHELRTPLNAMMGWTEILYLEELPEGNARKAVEAIRRAVRVQAQLIDDLLDLSRIASGRMRLAVRSLRPERVTRDAIDAVRPAAHARRIDLRAVIDPSPGLVRGDPERMQQILWNLLDNSIKFTPEGGHVVVAVERVESHVDISVQDDGQGIEPRLLPHVFERFRQGEPVTTRTRGGLGIGLALVKELVEMQGGEVTVLSVGIGKGATFVVSFPVASIGVEAGPDASAEGDLDSMRAVLRGLDVLAVDDDDDAVELVRLVLERSGAIVRTARSVEEAMEQIECKLPDLLVSDIGMPGEDGYALIRRLRTNAETSQLPAIALTAYARPKDRRRALASGFQNYVVKPVEPSELLTVAASVAQWHKR